MNTNSISSLSSSDLQSIIASAANSPTGAAHKGKLSPFALIMGNTSSSEAAKSPGTTLNPAQFLAQMIGSYQTNGLQSQGSQLDPMLAG
jgi:hypothetical protein